MQRSGNDAPLTPAPAAVPNHAGVGQASFGVNYIRTTYDSLDGVDIRGQLRTVLMSGTGESYEGLANLNITTDTVVFFSNVALNSWFDVAVAIPYVQLMVSGTHAMVSSGGEVAAQAEGSATASGVGDIAVRAKMRVYLNGYWVNSWKSKNGERPKIRDFVSDLEAIPLARADSEPGAGSSVADL